MLNLIKFSADHLQLVMTMPVASKRRFRLAGKYSSARPFACSLAMHLCLVVSNGQQSTGENLAASPDKKKHLMAQTEQTIT